VNALLLSTLGRESPWWVTYRQAQQLGGNVRKGEKGVRVIYWKPPEEEDEESRRASLLKTYTVFNLEQCDGIEAPAAPSRLATAEDVIAGMPQRPSITHGASASYNVAADTVTIPALASFKTAEGYYAAVYHELAHSTGHRKRLNRPGVTGKHAFGSTEYAKEELVAEIGAAFLCGETGINTNTIKNTAAYIDSWLKKLQAQPSILVHAAAAAQRTADYILNRGAADNSAPIEEGRATLGGEAA
jgi:antirestriction protein ArdC